MSMRILSIVKIMPPLEKRKEILDIFLSIKGPVQTMHGCLAFTICEEEGEETIVFLIEQWQTWEDFISHIRSDLYARVLAAMELSRKKPEVSFFEVSSMKGMELIEAVRNPKL